MQDRATNVAKGYAKLFCTVQDDQRATKHSNDRQFHRGYSRPRMWAQYGDDHAGICLVLDRQALDAEMRKQLANRGALYGGSVTYVNYRHDDVDAFHLNYSLIRESSIEAVVNQKVEEFHRSYFFTKAEDWSNEIEWRWVLRGVDKEFEIVSIKNCLRAIILGSACPRVYDPTIAHLAEMLVLPVGRMDWYNGQPHVVSGPYNPPT